MLIEFLEVVAKLIEASAWPVVVALIALKYRGEFRSILNRLVKAKFGDTELLLSKEEAEETLAQGSEEFINLISGSSSELHQETNSPTIVRTGDIDGDERDELIILSPEGPYWSSVRVFKPVLQRNNGEFKAFFKLIGEIAPVNFLDDVRDIDSDGFAEIIVNEDDQDSDQPHVAGFREKVIYKLINSQLSEISREKLPPLNTQADMNEFAARIFGENEAKMNIVFNKILLHIEQREKIELKELMIKAQESWLEYRQNQAEANSEACKEGSIYPVVFYSSMSELTNLRISELENILQRKDVMFR